MKRINIFTVIIIMAVVTSLFQLDYLRKGFFSKVLDYSWVQGSLWPNHTAVCTHCGTETTVPESRVVTFTPERIIIDSTKIDLPVVSVPLKNGTWEVTPHVANYAEGTSLVNKKEGNVGIFAHARLDAFGNLKKVKPGDSIVVYGKSYRAEYTVETITKVAPNAVDVFYPVKEPVITLTTCDGFFDEKRLMVRAKLVNIQRVQEVLTMKK
jgi:LPXTG-site transpeptidase (sortase) family protein